MSKQILITIIMPTLNEEKRIEKALVSIRNQDINQDEVEILVIDGGSSDDTKKIIKNYNVRVLNNPKIVPEEAKKIGLLNSNGKYIIFMDADEEFINNSQLKNRILLFKNNENVKVILANGLKTPKGYPGLTRYVNSFGDPFSYFIYNFDGENLCESLEKKYKYINKTKYGNIYFIRKNDLVPIGDSGTTMLDLEYLKMHFYNNFNDPDFITTKFEKIISKTNCFGIINDDNINHYTSVELFSYLKKIKFRIINNINPNENISGYTARAKNNKYLNKKKYLFLIYCIIFPKVIIDSIILVIKKKRFIFLLHFLLVYYVLFNIILYSILKILKVRINNKYYGR